VVAAGLAAAHATAPAPRKIRVGSAEQLSSVARRWHAFPCSNLALPLPMSCSPAPPPGSGVPAVPTPISAGEHSSPAPPPTASQGQPLSVHSSAASQNSASPRSDSSRTEADSAGGQPEFAADVSQDDADTAGKGKTADRFRRRGIPCTTAGVERIGEYFTRVSATWMDNVSDIDEILSMRRTWLQQHGVGAQDIIPVEGVQELTRNHRNRWKSGRQDQIEDMVRSYGSRDSVQRSLVSMHRTWVYKRFGGMLWMQVVLACGDVPDGAIDAANEWLAKIISETEQRQPATSASEAATLYRRCPPREGPPRGVCHKESSAKKARGEAAQKSAIVARERVKWHQGCSTLSWPEWNRLVREAEARKARRAVRAAIAISADPTLQAPGSKAGWGDFCTPVVAWPWLPHPPQVRPAICM